MAPPINSDSPDASHASNTARFNLSGVVVSSGSGDGGEQHLHINNNNCNHRSSFELSSSLSSSSTSTSPVAAATGVVDDGTATGIMGRPSGRPHLRSCSGSQHTSNLLQEAADAAICSGDPDFSTHVGSNGHVPAASISSNVFSAVFRQLPNDTSQDHDHAVKTAHKIHWKILLLGQLQSFLMACSGASQSTLYLDCQLSAPTFTVGLFYATLACFLIPLYREEKKRRFDMLYATTTTTASTSLFPEAAIAAAEAAATAAPSPIAVKMVGNDIQPNATAAATPVIIAPYSLFGVIPLQAPPRLYFAMAFLDVYAQYLTVLAFDYTTITSVTLLDALAIPSAMILSRMFLQRQYTRIHFLGVVMCMLGVIFNVLQDYEEDEEVSTGAVQDATQEVILQEYPHKLWGDVMAIAGGLLFGATNVLGEMAVRNFGGPREYLGMLGFFATCICAVQTIILERDDIAEFFGDGTKSETCHRSTAWWMLLAFWISAVSVYVGNSNFLQISEATFLNLSLLTGDLWSVFFSVVAERIVPKPMFFVALMMTLSGVFVYEMAPSPVLEDRVEEMYNQAKVEDTESWATGGDVMTMMMMATQSQSNHVELKSQHNGKSFD